MRLIRQQRELIIKEVNTLQNDMLAILDNHPPKQKFIDEYIELYNKFLQDNLDLIEF